MTDLARRNDRGTNDSHYAQDKGFVGLPCGCQQRLRLPCLTLRVSLVENPARVFAAHVRYL